MFPFSCDTVAFSFARRDSDSLKNCSGNLFALLCTHNSSNLNNRWKLILKRILLFVSERGTYNSNLIRRFKRFGDNKLQCQLLDNSEFRVSTLNKNRGQTILLRLHSATLLLCVIINHLIHSIRNLQVTFTLENPFLKEEIESLPISLRKLHKTLARHWEIHKICIVLFFFNCTDNCNLNKSLYSWECTLIKKKVVSREFYWKKQNLGNWFVR